MQTVRVRGASLAGAAAELVTVEARFEPADRERTELVLSGLPDPIIRESRGRLVAALLANGLRLGTGRLFLNLVPAGKRKAGEMLDLPLALGAAAAAGHLAGEWLEGVLFLGEVGLDGHLHPVPGGLAAADAARAAGLTSLIGPTRTAREASHRGGLLCFGAESLGEVVRLLARGLEEEAALRPGDGDTGRAASARAARPAAGLDAIRGQALGKHALAAAAAGGHALLFQGPPGAGKTLLARALPDLLPAPDEEERIAITRVLSAVGHWPGGLARERPFRAPHHTTSYAGLVGGGSPPAPGEITLAHKGVLFLDELPEFRREALEALRQPLESGSVTLVRAGARAELPAEFQLVGAMNPCPCGMRGHPRLPCPCSPREVRRYRQRISGPLLDRLDLRVEVGLPTLGELAGEAAAPDRAGLEPDGAQWVERVTRARHRARERNPCASEGTSPVENRRLEGPALDRVSPLKGELRRLYERALDRNGLSARAIHGLRRLARTLADLEDEAEVGPEHAAQAILLRSALDEVP